jgi:hypothetical protein
MAEANSPLGAGTAISLGDVGEQPARAYTGARRARTRDADAGERRRHGWR